jgi:hypothetical protein
MNHQHAKPIVQQAAGETSLPADYHAFLEEVKRFDNENPRACPAEVIHKRADAAKPQMGRIRL